MLSSATDPKYLTAGILAEDSNSGERYMTVASHGFPNGRVFHPCAIGKEIGQVITEITDTDLTLVKLHNNIQFANETFQSPLGRGPTQLRDFVSIDESKIGANVYMNSPFTGYSEGTGLMVGCEFLLVTLANTNGSKLAGVIWVRIR
jgi:hypothetical protein